MAGRPSASNHEADDNMLPDEREVIGERGEDLDERDDKEFLTVDELAAKLGFERDE